MTSATTQGTAGLLALAGELAEVAPHVRDCYDLARGSILMRKAAAALERLAPTDPDIESVPGEG